MRIVAFDLSSETGLAGWDGVASRPTLATKKLVGYDYDIEDMVELWRIYLRDFHERFQPQVVVIEEWVAAVYQSKAESGDYNRASVNGQSLLRSAALQTMTRWFFKKKGCRRFIVTPQQWRKHAYGKAVLNAGENWKDKALGRMKVLGWQADSHNAAEAGLMLDWALDTKLKIAAPWRDNSIFKGG